MAYYCPEPLSSPVQRLLRRQRQPVVSDLTEVEMMSAISRKVREGTMSRQDARKVAAVFLTHLDAGHYARLSLEPAHFRTAREWISAFDVPLRTLDALHLAVAYLKGLRLATADGALARSARMVGVVVHRVS